MRINLSILAILVSAIGCSSSASTKASEPRAKTSANIQDVRDSVTETRACVDAAVSALAALSESNEAGLKGNFDRYDSSLEKLGESARKTRDHFTQFRLRRDAYLSRSLELSWDVQSPELRAQGEKRRTVLMDAYMTLNGKAQETRKAFVPLLASLEDCQRFMQSEFTGASAAALKPELAEIRSHRDAFGAASDALVAELGTLAGKMDAEGGSK